MSTEFSRQEHWSGVPFPSPEDLPRAGIKPASPASAGGFLATEVPVQFSSVTQSCLTLCNSMDCSTPGLPVHHQHPELAQIHVHRASDVIQPSHPLSSPLLLPSIFPSIRDFSNESVLHIRWPKYWSFSFSISPSNKHPGLISFRMD